MTNSSRRSKRYWLAGYADATHNLANSYLQIGNLEEAEQYFLEALEYNPDLYQSYYSLALVSYKQGNLEQTRKYLERSLSINPSYAPARQAEQALQNQD